VKKPGGCTDSDNVSRVSHVSFSVYVMERAGVHNVTAMNTMGDRAGFKRRAQQVQICKGPQEEAGSWVRGQAEGHTQGVQKGNSRGREKASNVVREIR
jgi:hypothetical protein